VDVTLRHEDGHAVARRDGVELRVSRGPDGPVLDGDPGVLDHPDGVARAWAAVHCVNAGDVLVSAADGWELLDLGGGHHLGGGSHGSLLPGDSFVPVLAAGLQELGAAVVPSQGNFVMADFPGRPGKELFEALLREGVVVRPLGGYGFPTAHRVTVGLPEENERLLAALKRVLAA